MGEEMQGAAAGYRLSAVGCPFTAWGDVRLSDVRREGGYILIARQGDTTTL